MPENDIESIVFGFSIGGAGDHDDRQMRMQRAQFAYDLDSGRFRQQVVGDDRVQAGGNGWSTQQSQSAFLAGSNVRLESGGAEHGLARPHLDGGIVNEQNG